MRLKNSILIVLTALLFSVGYAGAVQPGAVQNMTIVGQIAHSSNGYIIRGEKPAELFTILNAEPRKLARLAGGEKTVILQVRIVSGDNVEIETINGEPY